MKKGNLMNKKYVLILMNIYLIFIVETANSQIQNTWELLKRHEIFFKIKDQTDTSLVDTMIIEQPQHAFYKYNEDTLYEYDLDYEDSKDRNCYMLWANPYKLLNDTSFDVGVSQYPEVKISATFKIADDTLVFTELWWEDWPDYIYHQTKVYYFIKRTGFALPPSWWPGTECHSTSAIKTNICRPASLFRKDDGNAYNLLGQISNKISNGIKIEKSSKSLEINGKRK